MRNKVVASQMTHYGFSALLQLTHSSIRPLMIHQNRSQVSHMRHVFQCAMNML